MDIYLALAPDIFVRVWGGRSYGDQLEDTFHLDTVKCLLGSMMSCALPTTRVSLLLLKTRGENVQKTPTFKLLSKTFIPLSVNVRCLILGHVQRKLSEKGTNWTNRFTSALMR